MDHGDVHTEEGHVELPGEDNGGFSKEGRGRGPDSGNGEVTP